MSIRPDQFLLKINITFLSQSVTHFFIHFYTFSLNHLFLLCFKYIICSDRCLLTINIQVSIYRNVSLLPLTHIQIMSLFFSLRPFQLYLTSSEVSYLGVSSRCCCICKYDKNKLELDAPYFPIHSAIIFSDQCLLPINIYI